MAKRAYIHIAEHVGWDGPDVRDCRHQETRYDRPVFVVGGDYYAGPGRKAPRYMGEVEPGWREIVSLWDNETKLWFRPNA